MVIGGTISYVVGTPSGYDDDFSDYDRTFNLLWTAYAYGITPGIVDEYLSFVSGTTTTYDYGYLESNFILTGDFDIQVDFDHNNCPYGLGHDTFISGLGVDDGLGYPLEFIVHGGRYIDDTDIIRYWTLSDGTAVETTDKNGKLRIVRSGTNYPDLDGSATLYYYYWNGSIWVELNSHSYNNNDCKASLEADKTAASPAFSIDCRMDNFLINSVDSISLP